MKLPVNHEMNFPDGMLNPYRYLDFSDALRLMRDGYHVVREDWGDDLDYIFISRNGTGFIQHGACEDLPYRLAQEDILAKDWYMADVMSGFMYGGEEETGYLEAGFREAIAWPTIIRGQSTIFDLMNEAYDRVAIDRSFPCDNPEIEKKRRENWHKIVNKYDDLHNDETFPDAADSLGIDTENIDTYHGFWSGVLATTRWVRGDEKWDLDT